MTATLPELVFFGSDDFSLPSLITLHEAGWPIRAVVTKPDSPAGRGRQLTPPVTKTWAEENHVPVLQPVKLADVSEQLSQFGVQLGVVASYGKIIPDDVLGLFPQGLVNVHPSLLPKYRGPAPIEAAILNGDTESGVSLIRLTSQMDAGPIYAQQTVSLTGQETQPELYSRLSRAGADLLAQHLPDIADGKANPSPQEESQATYTSLIKKTDGDIDWNKPAEDIERQIRSYLTWPGSRAELFGRQVTITRAHTVPSQDPEDAPGTPDVIKQAGIIMVATASGSLCIERLKPAGSREMSAAEFLTGIRTKK